MRGKRKHQFVTALLVFAVAIVGVCYYYLRDDNLSREEIFALVEQRAAELESIAQSNVPTEMKGPEGVQRITVVDDVVDFYCGAGGVGADAVYYGFYYSPGGTADAVFCGTRFGETAQLQSEDGGFVIRDERRYYLTRQITGNFFYYEAHF